MDLIQANQTAAGNSIFNRFSGRFINILAMKIHPHAKFNDKLFDKGHLLTFSTDYNDQCLFSCVTCVVYYLVAIFVPESIN